ncbi:NAD-dependent epimerase/dehydratase family protein [Sulfitobacter pseudonitzschiae]|uniref:NAD-dependent epimerase/dehydratase family protein n=1 Tax=Pseudosulfitobacter pseudonitzschiae TaxID=1402135 RepID=A0A9Q2RVY7_9RHOB|nr:D-erythronate dehydrogenase [Pseudosulfitobacter pseudonitzschiae]MBM2293509.1 NAD-dependent epimerase/dehydratase family protein [Pseudosulfitobacter pseudonitzschiae]MBM2298323.1 NAD-dependent epimerase/dehydratase family protein [Pseudosulfitobacter pseudonitzschiae]MBM2303237.1 NAD-dependent epimerase/dehydratase family protein [Pseudosulfitobacter pseudonitzschiae]MBM2313020.1 NAD-dependent epimerase/dehydratase family protein [Pseudosulfitobacter pseudonitzschiae]MBM2317933.1 NAD-depe
MNILIIGGGGVVGQKLAKALAAKGTLRGAPITRLTLADVVDPAPVDAPFPVETTRCDIADAASVAQVVTQDTDVIYLLAAIVSAHAEEDFDAGMQINLFGTYNVLERCRTLGNTPVVVFTSSIAVYGGEAQNPLGDHSYPNPQTSYGGQKAIGEILINDYSRKGFIDGRAFRLPTISVRPGKPNRAASSFMSSILREPLNGQEAVCPVDGDFLHYYLSPRKCADNLVKAAELDAAAIGQNRAMQMPGKVWSIDQVIAAMTAVAGPEPAKLIRWEAQPEVQAIVSGWRWDIHADKAERLGLEADASFEDNIRYYLEDDKPTA